MSGQKVLIPIAKHAELASMLHNIAQCLEKSVEDYTIAGVPGVEMDGWLTLVKGLTYVVIHTKKITGPASRIHAIKPESLLEDGLSEKITKATRKDADQILDEARQGIAAEPKPKYKPAKKSRPTKKR
jgi:hypothetical protein